MSHKNLNFESLLSDTTVIPVMVIQSLSDAVPMAQRLLKQGFRVLEVTLRTDCALDAVKEIIAQVPDCVVGVGTITTRKQFLDSFEAGAAFGVSPGVTDELIAAADEISLPLLAGVNSISEAMKLQSLGYRYLKFFPAEAAGGIPFLKSLGGPLPDLIFCPTGGITEKTSKDYLKLKNVICVGGSWMV